MKKNIRIPSRIIRGLIGLVIIGMGFYFQSWWGALGLIPLFEAIFGWCAFRHFCGNKECGKE